MSDDTRGARTEAVRALEAQFSDLFARFRRFTIDTADRVHPGLLPGAYKVFTMIAHRQAITQSSLAELLAADKGHISRTVRELEEIGLVQRTPDPNDRRSSILSPTEHGLERLSAARVPQEGTLLEALAAWTVEDIETLARLLQALGDAFEPDAAHAPAAEDLADR